jgi:hypothetical protein
VNGMYRELLDALANLAAHQLGSGLHGAATGWAKVDGQLAQLRERYATARTTEDFQAVGLLCRDIVISLSAACYDHEAHGGGRGKEPTGALDRLEKVVGAEAAGASNKQLRQLLKAAMEFANHVQHDRAGTRDDAAVCAEATVTVVTLFRLVTIGAAPIREPEPPARGEPEPDGSIHNDIPF